MTSLVDRAGRLSQAGLAVIGAAVLGAIAIGFVANLLTTLVFGKRMPPLLARWVRIFSALASGIAVGMIVFSGTGGFGLGGGFGSSSSGITLPASSPAAAKSEDTARPSEPTRVGVTILGGGRVRGEAFYQVDHDLKPKTLLQLEPTLASASAGTMALRLYDDSVARDHAAVTGLIARAERCGWKVVIEEFKGQSLPPEPKQP